MIVFLFDCTKAKENRMKLRKRIFYVACITLCLLFVVTYSGGNVANAATTSSPVLSKTKLTLALGEQKLLQVKGTSEKVTWTSSNTKVVRVTKKGVVKTRRVGNATVTATVGKKNYTCQVTVKKPTIVREEYAKNYYSALFSDGFIIEIYPGDLKVDGYKNYYIWATYDDLVGAVYQLPLKNIVLKGYNTKTEQTYKRVPFDVYSADWCEFQTNLYYYLDFDHNLLLYGKSLSMVEGYAVFKKDAKINAFKYDDGTHKLKLYL